MIKDGIRHGGIASTAVPYIRWQLTGYDGGSVVMIVFHDLQQIMTLFRNQPGTPPVIQYQHISFASRTSNLAYVPSPLAMGNS